MNILEAERSFSALVDRVYREKISIDLERDDTVIARLSPAAPPPRLTVGELRAFLLGLPSLGDDATAFSADLQSIRNIAAAEQSPWDS